MEKIARKPSTDPAQEKLREAKAEWNKKVSNLISAIIEAKKTLNGFPSQLYKERSKIIFPLPVDIPSILSKLTSEFNELAQEASAITNQQAQYSKTRRLPRKQQAEQTLNQLEEKHGPTSAPIPSPFANIASFDKYDLEVLASNKLTRTYTKLTNPTFGYGTGAKRRRYRMVMLKKCTKIYKALGKLQTQIVNPFNSYKGVKEAHDLIWSIVNEWRMISDSLVAYKDLVVGNKGENEVASDPATEVSDLMKENVTKLKEIVGDIKDDMASVIGGKIYDAASFSTIIAAIDAFNSAKDFAKKSELANQVMSKYKLLVSSICSNFHVKGESLKDIEKAVAAKKPELETVAQAFIKKWIGKTRHNLLPSDSSDYRLSIYDLAEDCRNELNALMNLIERRKTPVDEIEKAMKKVELDIVDIRTQVYNLYRAVTRGLEGNKK